MHRALRVRALCAGLAALSTSTVTLAQTTERRPARPVAARGRAAVQTPVLAPGNHTFKLDHGGRNREYIIHVPAGAALGKDLPLLLAFHGGGGEAAGFQASAGLDAVADRETFLAVYPYGTGALPRRLLTWNAGECCGSAMTREVDDVAFAIAVIDDVMRRTRVDSRRIYATGHSNGGMFVHRLAAERADRIVAIVAVSGAYDMERFAPSRPVAVLDIHSVSDPRALYEGGQGPALPGTTVRSSHRPVMEGVHRWTANNKCRGDSTVVETRTGTVGTAEAGQSAVLLRWKGCAAGGAVAQWKLTGVGHGWPGDTMAVRRERLTGPGTTLVRAADEVWKFVSKVRR